MDNNYFPAIGAAVLLCFLVLFTSVSAHAEDATAETPVQETTEETTVTIPDGTVSVQDSAVLEKLTNIESLLTQIQEQTAPTSDASSDSSSDDSAQALQNIETTLQGINETLQATPETAQEPTIWEKDFNDYTPTEGYLLLAFVIILSAVFLFCI